MDDRLEESSARSVPARDTTSIGTRLLELLAEQFSERALQELSAGAYSEAEQRLWYEALHAPLARFLSRPGKAIRANLVEHSYQLAGGRGRAPELLGLVVEVLHAGSLIIDDIEDASDLRRGAPTLHREIGLPLALNAGNWLYFWAFALLEKVALGPVASLAVQRWLSRTLLRCHFGQALDLQARVFAIEQRQMLEVVASATRFKTGCLMELCAVLGARAARARTEHVQALGDFGLELGMALQMLDDNSGLCNGRRYHKGIEDLERARPTWPWAWLAQSSSPAAFAELQRLARDVRRTPDASGERSAVGASPGHASTGHASTGDARPVDALAARLHALLGNSGQAQIRDHNRAALERLGSRIGAGQAAQAAALVRELEQGYA